jgi:tRNA(adenine34) deaminase
MLNCTMSAHPGRKVEATAAAVADEQRMRELVRFTLRTMTTERPVPFGALIVETSSGRLLQRAVNAVVKENDPSSHAELRAVRLACRRLKGRSLAGYTLYTTCEPCPMCMTNCLWARLDRVVYGATIADASVHCDQIYIPAEEVVRRSDIQCVVDGPVMHELCYTLFTHPNMLKAFKAWASRPPKISSTPRPKASTGRIESATTTKARRKAGPRTALKTTRKRKLQSAGGTR